MSSIHAHGKDLISLFSNSKCLSICLFSDKLGFGALQSDWHSKIKNLSPILHSNHILSIIGKHGRITSVLSASPPVIGRCMKSEQCTGFISLLYANYDSSSLLYLNDLLSFVLYHISWRCFVQPEHTSLLLSSGHIYLDHNNFKKLSSWFLVYF